MLKEACRDHGAWGAASVLGVAALLHTSATAFSALKLLGAA